MQKHLSCKNVCHNLYSRDDQYSRKTYIPASADDMVGKFHYMLGFIEKQYPENFALLILTILDLSGFLLS